jgi:chromosome segregation ATPase
VAECGGELEAYRNDIQQLQQRMAELQAAIDERDAALAGERQELAAVRAALTDAEQGRAALQEVVGAHRATVAELTGARQSLGSALAELDAAQSRLAALERRQARENETLQGEITTLREQLKQREQEATACAETARNREAEVASLKQAVAAAEHVAKSALRALATEPGVPIAPEPRKLWRWLAFLTPLTKPAGL